MQVIAHRGASAYAPENTLAAFRTALDMGAKSLELDVRQTRDGRLVVIHDKNFKRVGGSRCAVRNLTWHEARLIDMGSWFHVRFKGERLPLLEEVLDLAGPRTELFIELKAGSSRYPGIERRVLRLLRRRGLGRRALLCSFDHRPLFTLRELDGDLRIATLLGSKPFGPMFKRALKLKAEAFHMNRRRVSARRVRLLKDHGLLVRVFTVNTRRTFLRLKRLGVDAVISNRPDIAAL